MRQPSPASRRRLRPEAPGPLAELGWTPRLAPRDRSEDGTDWRSPRLPRVGYIRPPPAERDAIETCRRPAPLRAYSASIAARDTRDRRPSPLARDSVVGCRRATPNGAPVRWAAFDRLARRER